jgi:membrane protein
MEIASQTTRSDLMPMVSNSEGKHPDKLEVLHSRVTRLAGGIWTVVRDALQHFGGADAAEAAASITFYGFFSLFPLLLALIVGGSFVLESEQVQGQVLDAVAEVFPVAERLIERNIQAVLGRRGTVGFVALISLVWSATGALTVLARNISRAWPGAEPRGFIGDRLTALGMVSGLAVLLVISSISNTVLNVLARFSVPIGSGLSMDEMPLWATTLSMVPRLFVFLALLGLYRWVPNTTVKWSEAFWGALVATPAGEIATNGFSWYLSSGIVRYELVYGSLGTIVALMLWIYIGVLIALFGAHLAAAVTRYSAAGARSID